MANTDPEKVKIGDWYTWCCELSLEQIQDEEDLRWVRSMMSDSHPVGRTWPTKEAALQAPRMVDNIVS